MISKTVDVYVAHTPLHILFTLNLIEHNPEQHPVIVFILDDFFHSGGVAIGLQEFLGPQHQVTHLPGAFLKSQQGVSANVKRHVNAVRALVKARRIYQHYQVRRLMIFNDTRSEVQAIIQDLKNRGVEQVLYVEDGIAPYYESSQKRNQKLVPLFRSLYKGYQPTTTHGSFPGLGGAILLHPHLANQHLKTKPCYQMPPFAYDQSTIETLLALFGASRDDLINVMLDCTECVLICLPKLDQHIDRHSVTRWIQRTATQYGDRATLFLKYHPREISEDPLHVVAQKIGHVVSRAVPAELLCEVAGEKLAAVYADGSSILLTTRWINPNARVYSVNWSGRTLPAELQNLFSAVGVQTIESPHRGAL